MIYIFLNYIMYVESSNVFMRLRCRFHSLPSESLAWAAVEQYLLLCVQQGQFYLNSLSSFPKLGQVEIKTTLCTVKNDISEML